MVLSDTRGLRDDAVKRITYVTNLPVYSELQRSGEQTQK